MSPDYSILKSVGKSSFVLAVRQAVGESQSQFADRLGVNVRTIKRFEADDTEPTSIAVRRQLEALAKRHGITRSEKEATCELSR